MLEEWIKWSPIEKLDPKYNLDSISYDSRGLNIFIRDNENANKIVKIVFESLILSYRVTEEKFTSNLLDFLQEKYGKEFYVKNSFFIVNKSSYIKSISDLSGSMGDYFNPTHFVIFTLDYLIDVVSTDKPEFEIIYEK